MITFPFHYTYYCHYIMSHIYIIIIANAVTVTEVHIMSINSGRSDYVIQGESAQLSCHYLFTKPEEKVASVRWEKDGQDVQYLF
jgi:hypothetical protein